MVKRSSTKVTSTGSADAAEPAFRSRCSIARGLEIFGDRWTLLVVRDLMWHGKHRFQALQASAERMPSNILAARLRRLIELGLVERRPYQAHPPRYEYYLSARGRSLEPVLRALMEWGHAELGGGYFDPAAAQASEKT